MLIKYSLGIQAMSVIRLAGWVLLIPQFFCASTTCLPPDFPEGGAYEPEKAEYEEGMRIKYSCYGRKEMFVEANWDGPNKVATCNSSGKWSIGTPFCDSPAKISLKDPEEDSYDFTSDGDHSACIPVPNARIEYLEYSLKRKAVIYSTAVCWWHGRSTVKICISELRCETHNEDFGYQMVGCWHANVMNNDQESEGVTVEVSPDKDVSSILLCEIYVFAKNDVWCKHPPKNSVPNGQLEVSRSKAVLHCNEGFKEKHGRRIYATCENNTWSYLSLQCVGKNEISCDSVVGSISLAEGEWDNDRNTSEYDVGTERTLKCKPGYHSEGEPLTVTCEENGTWTRTNATCKIDKSQKDFKVLAIVVGSLVAIIIIILIGVKLFFISRKKPVGIYVIYKPFGNNSHSRPSSVGGHSITSLSEAETKLLL